jgi:cell division protein ZapA (FtsZ GTPase activity inhibitor)
MTAELARAQAALGTVMIFCNESQHDHLAQAMERIDATMKSPEDTPAVAELYESIVACARRDFRHR